VTRCINTLPPRPTPADLRFRAIMGQERARGLSGEQMLHRYFNVDERPPRQRLSPQSKASLPLWAFPDGTLVRARTLSEARALVKQGTGQKRLPAGLRAHRVEEVPAMAA
jgi:hypothetical protein